MHVRSSETRVISVSFCGRHQNGWQNAEFGSHCEKDDNNVDIDESTYFFGHVYLGCTQRECKPNETTVEQYAKMFESRISAGATEKIPGWQKPHAQTEAWSNDMEGLLKIALSDTVNWQTRKWSNFTKFYIVVWMITNSNRRNSNLLEKFQKFAHKLSWNAGISNELEDPTFYGQSTSLRDQSQNGLRHVTDAWQGFDFLDSLHKRFPATLSCGKHGMALQTRFVPTLRFCWRPWGLKIHLRWCLVYFWKQNICPSELDVRETNCCLAQFHRFWNYFSGLWTTYGWVLRMIEGDNRPNLTSTRQHFKPTEQFVIPKPRPRMSKASRWLIKSLMWITCPPIHILLKVKIRCTFLKTTKMIKKGRSPTMRHASRIHRVALDWLYDRINLECLRSKSNMLTPTTNSQTYWQREVSQEMNGITFCVCSISWVSRCILVATSKTNFLSLSQDRERTVSGAMSKRGQNTTSDDGSPTAKARPINLVMHSLGKEEISSQSSGSLVNLVNDDNRKRAGLASGNCGSFDSKLRSRMFPSESTREGWTSLRKLWQ